MTAPYIGTPTFRIDDHGNVTGGAKDAGLNRSSLVKDISRCGVLNGAVALGTVGCGEHSYGRNTPDAAIAIEQEHQGIKPMAPYIGAPTSRVDGRAKVTGAAKYAAEFSSVGLAYGSVVSSHP